DPARLPPLADARAQSRPVRHVPHARGISQTAASAPASRRYARLRELAAAAGPVPQPGTLVARLGRRALAWRARRDRLYHGVARRPEFPRAGDASAFAAEAPAPLPAGRDGGEPCCPGSRLHALAPQPGRRPGPR